MQSYDGLTGEPFTNIYADDDRGGKHPKLGDRLPLAVARAVAEEGVSLEEQKANARLIAAAPTMHTFLRHLADERFDSGDMENGYVKAVTAARALLASIKEDTK